MGSIWRRCTVDWPSIIAAGGVAVAIIWLMLGIGRVVGWAANVAGRLAALEYQVKELEKDRRERIKNEARQREEW
jgi:hypothetical protein